jgi:3'-phosphoadenosine 5'-phosphosulfate sulfotransferase (PAPS reductase)/FAD synthetase
MYLADIGRIRMKMGVFRRKVDKAKLVIRQAFEQSKNPYVAVSGGKDSIAMLGIVNDVATTLGRDYEIWAHLSDASFPGTQETIERAGQQLGRGVIIDWSPVSAFDVVGRKGSNTRHGKKGYFFDAIKNYVVTTEKDLAFVGVRAGESKRRRTACNIHGQLFQTTVPSPILMCYPLAWFAVEDVAAAILYYDLPIHPIYGKDPIGCDPTEMRLGYTTAREMLNYGTAVFLKVNYPDIFNKIAVKWPEIRQFV